MFSSRGTHVQVTFAGRSTRCLERERLHVGMPHLPPAGHLFDHQLGIHSHLEWRCRVNLARHLESGNQAAIFGHIVCRPSDGQTFGCQDFRRLGVSYQRSVRGWSRVAPGSAIRLHNQLAGGRGPVWFFDLIEKTWSVLHAGWSSGHHKPDCEVRIKIRPHSSQRSTSSSAAAANVRRSAALISSWQPVQRRARSSAAPMPLWLAPILS